MEDGTLVMTEVIKDGSSMNHCLDPFLQHMSIETLSSVIVLLLVDPPTFFDNMNIIFVGVHIKDDVKKLRKCIGLEIKNAVDLSELAADVLNQPRLRVFGVRRLASEVLLEPFMTSSSIIDRDCWIQDLAKDQIECATTEAYAAYKIGKKLLGV
ncbi:hypothetical protein REPUB_Repub06bG0049400 [Reevesia pubescens]